MKKLSEKEKQLKQHRKDHSHKTWATFIIGIAFCLVGFRRLLQDSPAIMMNPRTKHPILDNGNYPIFIGLIMIILGLYRALFLKNL
jgi:hypothetical protein